MIYAIKDSQQHYKIGFTRNSASLRSRITTLQTGHAKPLRLVCSAPGSMYEERAIHELLAPCRLKGEWFADGPSSSLTCNAIHLLEHYGAPFLLSHTREQIDTYMPIGRNFPRLAGLRTA